MKRKDPMMNLKAYLCTGTLSLLVSTLSALETTNDDVEINGSTGATTTQPGLKVTGDGGVLFEGTFGSGSLPAEGPGTRMMWYPGKAAFRAGKSYNINESQVGNYSAAFGDAYSASGDYSFAAGTFTDAWGIGSVALGIWSYAGNGSFAFGNEAGADNYSIAMGHYAFAYGQYSVSIGGQYSEAAGDYSAQINGGFAIGRQSLAMNGGATYGELSVAIGAGARADSYKTIALGANNVGGYSDAGTPADTSDDGDTQWLPEDPLLEVGNGTAFNARSNALTVYKNGNMAVQGVVTAAPGGDIPMFQP